MPAKEVKFSTDARTRLLAGVDILADAVKITSFCKNLLGEDNTEECLNTATLIKAERYNWKRHSQTLPGQSLKEQKRWLEVWQRLELTDMSL